MIDDSENLEQAWFEQAAQKSSPTERAAFLDEVCRDKPGLRARLEVLLEGHFGGEHFLTQTPKRPERPRTDAPRAGTDAGAGANEGSNQVIGRYRLLERIGEGGFGEVWMAEQSEPVKRRVALKILKPGMDSQQIVARFKAEQQALALMEQASIAKVFDAGATETGRPYFVMELVKGARITDYCDQHQLRTHERLKLFIPVCQAIQHAHQKGIIHRDIKPSNILITVDDGVPVPKVIDFGIAKATQRELTDQPMVTQIDQFIGTPAYISPEQAGTGGLDIDTRSDIYSLGVLLYELLVGRTPFDGKEMVKGGLDMMRQIVREHEPAKPSTKFKSLPAMELTITAQRRQTDSLKLAHLLRGDLDWIVMKCLEKDRARRYETANGLALDIQRYLANEPVLARPPTALYRVQKTVRRNKLAVIAGSLLLLVLLGGISAVVWVQHRANQDYRQRLYISELNRAGTAWQAGRSSQLRELLDRCPADLRNWEWKFLRQQADLWTSTTLLVATNLGSAKLSADKRLVAAAMGDVIQVRDIASGQRLRGIPFKPEWFWRFEISPRDEYLASYAGSGPITVWNMRTGERVAEMNHGSWVQAIAWSSDRRRLASVGDDGIIRIWNAETGQRERTFPMIGPIFAVAFSPDDQTLAIAGAGAEARLLDIATGAVKRTFRARGGSMHLLRFSPDGHKLATSSATEEGESRDNRVWNLEDGDSLDLSIGAAAVSFAFSADSRQLFMADFSGMIRLWDLDQRAEIERFSARAQSVELLPDGRIFSAAADGAVRIWQARRSTVLRLKGYTNALRTLAFTPDSRWLVSAGLDRKVPVWDERGGLAGVYTNHQANAVAVATSHDGRVATASSDRMVQVWDPASLTMIWEQSLAPDYDAYWLSFSPNGQRLFVASHTDAVIILDAKTGQRINRITGFDNILDGLAISQDGRLLAVCHKAKLSVCLADGSKMLWQVPANPERCASFSSDGKWIATGDQDGTVSLWEVASEGRVRRRLTGHAGAVSGVSFSPDGSRLVSSSFDGQIKIWDWKAGAELLALPLPGGRMAWHAVFSPNGKTIAAAGGDGIVTLWKTE